MLKWEILESALGSAPEGAPGNRGAPGGCSRECSGRLWVLPRVLFLLTPHRTSTLGSTLGSTPNLPEHSREHPPEHPPRALSRISHFSTPVTGGRDCNSWVVKFAFLPRLPRVLDHPRKEEDLMLFDHFELVYLLVTECLRWGNQTSKSKIDVLFGNHSLQNYGHSYSCTHELLQNEFLDRLGTTLPASMHHICFFHF